MEVVVRRGEARDVEGILRVEQEVSEAPRWGEARYREILRDEEAMPRRVLLVAESGEGIVGFGAAVMVLDEAEVESVAVALDWRRRGVGAELCREMVAWAKASEAVVMRLEVRSRSAAARRLYSGMGFEECGLRVGYYADPADDAVLMGLMLD